MTTMNGLVRPLPLKIFLDNDGNPREVLGDRFRLIFDTVTNAQVTNNEHRAHSVEVDRWQVDTALKGEPCVFKIAGTETNDDPALGLRLLEFCTPEDARRACGRNPCDGCGTVFETGDEIALTLGNREPYSNRPDPQTIHCFECIAMAYEAMKAASK